MNFAMPIKMARDIRAVGILILCCRPTAWFSIHRKDNPKPMRAPIAIGIIGGHGKDWDTMVYSEIIIASKNQNFLQLCWNTSTSNALSKYVFHIWKTQNPNIKPPITSYILWTPRYTLERPIPIIGSKHKYLKGLFLRLKKIASQKVVATWTSPLGKPKGSYTDIKCKDMSGRDILNKFFNKQLSKVQKGIKNPNDLNNNADGFNQYPKAVMVM